MIGNLLRTLLRIAIAIGLVALTFFAFWFVLVGAAVLILGGFLYTKLTGKKIFQSTSYRTHGTSYHSQGTSYSNIRVVRVYPPPRTDEGDLHNERPHTPPPLISDAVDVIDAEIDEEKNS